MKLGPYVPLLAAILLAGAPVAFAEPAGGKKPPTTAPAASASAAPAAPAPRSSAIVQLSAEIAQGLGQVPPGALVVVSPLSSDVPAPKGDDLSARVAAQIAGRLGVAHAHPQPASLAVARGLSGRAASLVWVQLEVAKGELRATADLYPVIANGWERLRNPAPGPRAHAFAATAIDAEVRTFLQPIVLEQASVRRSKHDETDVLAIGCGDVDSDGGLEIVIASRARVVVGKLRGGKLSVTRTTPWAQLASRAPVPMREPIATVIVSPHAHRGEVLLGNTDRGAVAVDGSLVTRRQLAGLPVPGADGDACVVASPEYGVFEGPGIACHPAPTVSTTTKADPVVVLTVPAPRFDTIAALDLVAKDGGLTQVVAAREPNGKLRLRKSEPSGRVQELPIESTGAQLAMADLDLDGTPEIAFSADSPDSDTLTVASWGPSGLVQRLRFPTKDPVRAIAACPPEAQGLPGLVAVVGSEVWLVR